LGPYLLRRAAVLLITLLGIIIVTFVVSRLTPGDPALLAVVSEQSARGGQGSSDEAIRETRRVMGLDRPLLFNWRGEDREWHAADLLHRYLTGTGFWKESARFELAEMNQAAMRAGVGLLATETNPERRRELLELLPDLARLSPADRAALAQVDAAKINPYWTNWLSAREQTITPEVIARGVQAWVERGDEAARSSIEAAGGLAIPALIPEILDGTGEKRDRAMRVALGCVNKPASWGPGATDTETAEAVYRWGSWWRRVHLRFEMPSLPRRGFYVIANTQFGLWFGQYLTLDFGVSTRDNRPVIQHLMERLPITMQINVLVILLTYFLAIPMGIFSATHQDTRRDRTLTILLFLLHSVPVFWLSQLLILTLTGGPGWLDWFPSRGVSSDNIAGASWWRATTDRLWHLVLPVVAQTVVALAFLSRQMRVALLEVVRQDFIRTARAKGLSEAAVIYKHALRNSLIPVLTLSAELLPQLIGGSVIVESLFSINGMGKLTFDAILNRNYPIINCVFAFSALLTLVGILLADIGYALVDPRIRYGGGNDSR
jgi:peptide/nickel transport system permease protein